MDRLADRLAQQVPESDVDGADGAHAGRALALPEIDDQGFRCIGLRPISIGLRCVISPCPSTAAEFDAEPRKAWPSTPSSVAMRSRPSALEPAKRLCWPYCVGGMSSQANKVRLTSVIFMVASSFGERKGGSPCVRFAPGALQYRLPA
jgi:hypothetical protein